MLLTEGGSMPYQVKLPVFEGPLDLLLHLIEEQEVDIYDIPIARITEAYLRYLAETPELDLEGAGEFLLMAATLVHIKSKMLLPRGEVEEEEETLEDPRMPLVERLLEYKRYKEAALALGEREAAQQLVYGRGGDLEPPSSPLGLRLVDLLVAFREVLKRAEAEPPLVIEREEINIRERMAFLLERLREESPIPFSSLFEQGSRRLEVIVTFLALLELLRQGLIRCRQSVPFGEIMISRGEKRA